MKALASNCNDFGAEEYATGLTLMYRLQKRGEKGIIFQKNCAGKERIPDNRRLTTADGKRVPYYVGAEDVLDDFGERDLYRSCDAVEGAEAAAARDALPESPDFTIVAHTDASFAVTTKMQSISGWVIYLNGSPILWGSLRQAVVVDSSCSAEYVASSICVKQVMVLVNMLIFLGVRCPRPYTVYTDSQAAMAIATNGNSMGNVRHLSIRTHTTRCYISLGDICMRFCVTEQQVGDLFTKVVAAAQEAGLIDRFYHDVDFAIHGQSEHSMPLQSRSTVAAMLGSTRVQSGGTTLSVSYDGQIVGMDSMSDVGLGEVSKLENIRWCVPISVHSLSGTTVLDSEGEFVFTTNGEFKIVTLYTVTSEMLPPLHSAIFGMPQIRELDISLDQLILARFDPSLAVVVDSDDADSEGDSVSEPDSLELSDDDGTPGYENDDLHYGSDENYGNDGANYAPWR